MSMNKRQTDSLSDNECKKIKHKETPEIRLKNVLRNEITQEIKIRSSDLITIEERIFQTKKAIERVRQGAVSAFYCEKYKGELQPPLHPAIKDTFSGKRPIVKEEQLSDDDKQNSTIAEVSTESVQKLPRYVPPKYEEKDIVQPFEPRGNQQKEKYRLIIGNVSKWIGNGADSHATHKWTVYIRCKNENGENVDVDEIFTSVVFYLHPSYKPHDVIKIDDPPFKLTRRGWGEFPLRVRFYFANELDKSLDVVHHIKLDRTQSGLETFGGETMVDAWAYAPGGTNNTPLDPETKPSLIPSLSTIPFSNDISFDILSEIFGGPDDSSKASFGDFIKTDPVPIEEIDIKPLDFQLIPPECIKTEPEPQVVYEMVPNEAIKEEIIIEPDEVKNGLNELFVYENTEVKEEIIYENDVKVIYDTPTDNNCDMVSNTQNIVNGSKIDNPQNKPIILCENKNISPIKLGNSLKTIKLIAANKTPIKIKPSDSTNKVLVFESLKKNSKNQLFKIVVDPKTLLNLPKVNGAKTNLTLKPVQNVKTVNFTVNPDKKLGGKVQNNLPKPQKPILITTNKGGKQTLVVQRKVLPGMSLLKKADTPQNSQNKETSSKTTASFSLQDCPSEKMEFAVTWLVNKFPLVDTRAGKDGFRSVHPYCAPSRNVFLSWPLGKQRAAEWIRAKTITKLLPKICTQIQPWSTVQVLDWCRLMGHTPKETISGSDLCIQEPITLNFSPPNLKNLENSIKKETIQNIDIMNNDADKPSNSDNKMYLPLPEENQDLANFISMTCRHFISKSITDEEIIPEVNFPSALTVLVSAFNSVAQDLIRRSYAASVIRHNTEIPEQMIENDVKNALLSRKEFDLFTNEGLGNDDN